MLEVVGRPPNPSAASEATEPRLPFRRLLEGLEAAAGGLLPERRADEAALAASLLEQARFEVPRVASETRASQGGHTGTTEDLPLGAIVTDSQDLPARLEPEVSPPIVSRASSAGLSVPVSVLENVELELPASGEPQIEGLAGAGRAARGPTAEDLFLDDESPVSGSAPPLA